MADVLRHYWREKTGLSRQGAKAAKKNFLVFLAAWREIVLPTPRENGLSRKGAKAAKKNSLVFLARFAALRALFCPISTSRNRRKECVSC